MSERSPSPQRAAYLRAQRRRKRLVLALQILLLAAFLGLWELSARLGWVDAFIVSSPSRVVHTLVGLQASGELWLHIGTSCLEVVGRRDHGRISGLQKIGRASCRERV